MLVVALAGSVALLMARQPPREGGPGAGQPSVLYVTEKGEGVQEGAADSTLRVVARFPIEGGTGDDVLSSVQIQFLGEGGVPAQFGGESPGPLQMRPGADVTTWSYDGSVPSQPGVYHPVFTLKRLFGGPEPERVEVPSATLRATPNAGGPITEGYAYNDDTDLWIVSPDASARRRHTFLGLRGRGEYAEAPSWSPDGKQIAFTYLPETQRDQLPATDIRVIEPGGAGMKVLVSRGPGESLSAPYWSPDGRFLYFSVESLEDGPVAGGTPEPERPGWRIDRLDATTGMRTVWATAALMPSTGGSEDEVIYMEETPGGDPAEPTYDLVRSSGSRETKLVLFSEVSANKIVSPRLSPDGKWLVYAAVVVEEETRSWDLFSWLLFEPQIARAHGLTWDLFLIQANGTTTSRPVRLTTLREDTPHATWLDPSTVAVMGVKGLFTLKIASDGTAAGEPVRLGNISGSGIEGARHSVLTWHGR